MQFPFLWFFQKFFHINQLKKTVLDWDTKYLIYIFETAQIISQFCPISSLHELAKHFNIHETKHHLHQRWVPY